MKRYNICLFLSLLGYAAWAQYDTIRLLNEVPVWGNRIQTGFNETSASVLVITAEQIKAAPVLSVPDVLHYLAGVDIRQRGANGVQADAGIRGSTFDQVLILVNGIKISDMQTGHHSLNLPVDIENVARIEVLKGPAARVFGQNAFAGAINIITKNPEEVFMKLQVAAGEHGLGGGKIAAAFTEKDTRHYISASRDFSDGYKYNTDYVISNYFYQASTSSAWGKIGILAGLTDRSFGANGFYASPDYQDQFESVQTSLVALTLRHQHPQANFSSESRLYWRRNEDEYVFVRSNPSLYRNLHINSTWGYEWNATWKNKIGITGIGIDVNHLKLTSNNLGQHNRLVGTLFVENRFVWLNERVDLTPGVQLNHYSDFRTVFLPGVDAGFVVTKNLKAYANWGYTYRVPTYTDLYYSDPVNEGNPNLQPEYAQSYEAGLKILNITGLQGQVSYFKRNGHRIIDWTKENPADRWRPDNLIAVTMQGVDLSATWLPHGINGIQSVNLGYTYITGSKATNLPFSRYALENLRHQVVASVVLRYGKQVQQSLMYRYSDRVNLPDYHVVDTRFSVFLKRFTAFLDVTNAFNASYRETNLVELPGRWAKAGVSYTLTNN
jgi:iron complex outermembrane receptor protein